MLFNRKGTATVLATGVVTLGLVAAAGTTTAAARGTASSSLDAVTLSVSGLDVPAVTLLQAGTFASTDPDAPGNVLGAPWANALIAPLLVDGVAQGAAEARSDKTGSASSLPAELAGVASMAPVSLVASATADSARATIGAAEGSLSILTDLLGLRVSSLGVDSVVTADGATNTQGLAVSGLDVSLGDLLPAELLEALPIDVLISLLNQLPIQAPDLQAVADAVTKLVADVQAGVEGIVATSAAVEEGVASLEQAIADLASQQAIVDGLNVDVAAAQTAATNAAANVTSTASALQGLLSTELTDKAACALDPLTAVQCIADVDAAIASARSAANAATTAAASATATVDQLAADLAKATSLVAPLAAVVDSLTDIVDALVAQLAQLVDSLLANLNDLVGALTNLSTSLGDVVDGLLDATLIGLGNLELTMSAVATDAVDTSSAGITCDLSGLVVAGIELGGGGCAGDSLTGSLSSAIGALEGVLGALPLVGNVVPEVTVDLMQLTSSVTEKDGVVTATSTVVPLVIDLPSVTVDPAAIVDGLLADITGLLDGLVASLPTSDLGALGLDAAAAQLASITGVQVPAIGDVEALVADVVALLPDGSGLLALTTPGFNLEIDPTSTASFSPAGSATPAAPAPAPAPLPATGGGAVALAALGLGGAWSLRRRR